MEPTVTLWQLLVYGTYSDIVVITITLKKEMYKICIGLCFIQLVMRQTGKEPAKGILHNAEREMLRCKYEWTARL